MSYSETMDAYLLHMDLKIWTPSHYKRYLQVFDTIKEALRNKGMTEVYGICEDMKAVKFNKMFGLVDTGLIAIEDDGVVNIITKLEL